jgi:DNA-binding beta-propeller fold protein YncE
LAAGALGARAYRAAGLACIYLGDEAVLDLERFSLEGRAVRIARQSWHRARRAGLTATVCRVGELDPGHRAALHALSARWRGAAPERGFSMALGRLLDPRDPGGFLVIGRTAGGRLLGFLHLVPWGDDGASLDVMRRERNAPAILNDFLVVEAARRLPTLGVRRLSLNFAFLRAVLEAGAGRQIPLRLRIARWALCRVTRPFPVESLYRFNKKFAPAWQPRYLAIQAPEDLPTVAVACLKAEGLLARTSRRSPGLKPPSTRRVALAAVLALILAVAGCTVLEGGRDRGRPAAGPVASTTATADTAAARVPARTDPASTHALPGMPAVLDPHDVDAATRPGRLSPVVRRFPARVYVPNSGDGTVDVIDPRTFRRVGRFRVGRQPQHVAPSWDLRTLWVGNDQGNSLTSIDPATGRPRRTVRVADPYNLYFTPDGRRAIVVAERLRRLDFRDPHTMRLRHSLPVPCLGVDHLDFSADGRSLLASCEFSGHLLRVDVATERVTGLLRLPRGAVPQDVKLAPDGRVYYVADMASGGVWIIDATRPRVVGFVPTGEGAHGLYVSRDSRVLYVSNRGEGSISLVSFATRKVVAAWRLPGGGSPDMGGVSADGKALWLTGRYDGEVYAIDTSSGRLLARVPVGQGPHGLCVYPQPGRYSLGQTGVFR